MIISNESEFSKWFVKNHKKLGYSKILRKDIGLFPDFIMEKNNKPVRIELETKASNFILHKHPINKVDEILCINKDVTLNKSTIKIKGLKFVPTKERITLSIDEELLKEIDKKIKDKTFGNRSHAFEYLIAKYLK